MPTAGTHHMIMEIAHCVCINAQALVAGGVTAPHSFRRYQGLIDRWSRSLRSLADWPRRAAYQRPLRRESYRSSMLPSRYLNHINSHLNTQMVALIAATAIFDCSTLWRRVSAYVDCGTTYTRLLTLRSRRMAPAEESRSLRRSTLFRAGLSSSRSRHQKPRATSGGDVGKRQE